MASGSKSGDGFIWSTRVTRNAHRQNWLATLQWNELSGSANHNKKDFNLKNTQSIDTSQDTLILKGHAAELSGLSFSKFNNAIVTCSDDHTIRVWQEMENDELENHTGVLGVVEVARKVERDNTKILEDEENVAPSLSISNINATGMVVVDISQLSQVPVNLHASGSTSASPMAQTPRPTTTVSKSPSLVLVPSRSAPSSSRNTPKRTKNGQNNMSSNTPSSSKSQRSIMSFFDKKQ